MPRNVHGFWLQHLNIFRCLYRSLVDTKMMEPQIPACGLEIQPQWQIAVREVPGHSNASVYPWSSCWGFFSPDCQHNCSVFQPCLSTCCALQLHQDWHQFHEIHLGRLAQMRRQRCWPPAGFPALAMNLLRGLELVGGIVEVDVKL